MTEPTTIDLANRHRGNSCICIGNGPSILNFKPSFFKKAADITIGCNEGLNFFRPMYYHCVEIMGEYIYEVGTDGRRYRIIKCGSSQEAPTRESGEILRGGWSGTLGIGLAYVMGCDPIYLVGHGDRIEGMTHFYKDDRRDRKSEDGKRQHGILYMQDVVDRIRKAGVDVINLSPISELR